MTNREREITVSVRVVDGTTLRISVLDDGEGISPENLPRIFTHGFTTRKDGHGFGLHSCGKGAMFTLEVPLNELPQKPAQASAAATTHPQ